MNKHGFTTIVCLCAALFALPFTVSCTYSSANTVEKKPEDSAPAPTGLSTPEEIHKFVISYLKTNGWQNSIYSCEVTKIGNSIRILISGTPEMQQAIRTALENKNEKAQNWEDTVIEPLKNMLTEIRNAYDGTAEINLLFQCEWDDGTLTLLELSGDSVYDYIENEKK